MLAHCSFQKGSHTARAGLEVTMQLVQLEFWSSWLPLPSAGITGINHCGVGNQTQDFMHTRQIQYHLIISNLTIHPEKGTCMYQGINIEAMEQVEGVKLLPFSTRVLGMKLRSGLAAKCHYLLSHLAGPRCFLGSSDSNSLKGGGVQE